MAYKTYAIKSLIFGLCRLQKTLLYSKYEYEYGGEFSLRHK